VCDDERAVAEGDEPASAEHARFSPIDGRYELIERIGAGAMGVVYRAHDVSLDRPVAVKVIDPKHASDPAFVAMFKAEARALARIRHESVVQVYTFGRYGDAFYLAMEYVAGTDLDTLITRRAAKGEYFELDHALGIVRRIGHGLAAVHAQGLVHRDVKPSNVLVEDATARPVLIDFGLVDARAGVVQDCMAMGTPEYMPPEQARGLPITARADVYALACTTFELLTGRAVFEDEDVLHLMTAHIVRAPPAISSIRPELEALDGVLLRALAKDPAKRHDSATAFVDELDEAVRRLGRRPPPSAPKPKIVPSTPPIRVLVFEGDETLRRQVVQIVERVLRGAGDAVAIECASSASEFASVVDGTAPDLVVIDDASAEGAIAALLDMIRTDVAPEVLVLRESFEHLGRDGLRVRELPKPLNAQVLASVVSKMAVRIVERRASPSRAGTD